MDRKILFCIILLSGNICFAQRPNLPQSGRVLNFEDSARITNLFFAGLRDKTIQNYQSSSNNFKQILEIDPANDAVFYELANIYHIQKQEIEAERMIREAVTIKPENEYYWLLYADIYEKTNNFSRLIEVFDKLIKIAPQKQDYYFYKANALLSQNKINEALAVYNEIEKKYGASDELLGARQLIYQKQGKPDVAAAELEKLIKSKPANSANYIELSDLQYNAGNKDKALQILQEAKNADPTNAAISLKLADLYRTLGKIEEANTELKSAFQNPAMDVDAKTRTLASILSQKDIKIKEQASDLAAILVQIHPSNAKVHAIYGDILLQNGKLPEAGKSYRRALELNDQEYLIWENLIRMEVEASDFDSAIKDGEEALSVFPSQAVLYLYTGIAYNGKKNYQKAVAYLKNAASLETENQEKQAQIYSNLGDAYIHLGETDLAVQQWIKARNSGLKSEKLDRKINEKKYIE